MLTRRGCGTIQTRCRCSRISLSSISARLRRALRARNGPRTGLTSIRSEKASSNCCRIWPRGMSLLRAGKLCPAATLSWKTGPSWVDSSGRRNTAYVGCSEELVQSLGRCSPAQGLSRPAVEGDRHSGEVLGAVHAEVGALWKVLAQQPVGVLVRAALPGAVGIAEVDRHASLDPQLGVLGHFRSLIPGQRLPQLFG